MRADDYFVAQFLEFNFTLEAYWANFLLKRQPTKVAKNKVCNALNVCRSHALD